MGDVRWTIAGIYFFPKDACKAKAASAPFAFLSFKSTP